MSHGAHGNLATSINRQCSHKMHLATRVAPGCRRLCRDHTAAVAATAAATPPPPHRLTLGDCALGRNTDGVPSRTRCALHRLACLPQAQFGSGGGRAQRRWRGLWPLVAALWGLVLVLVLVLLATEVALSSGSI